MQKIDLDKDPLGAGKLIKRLGQNLFGEMVEAGGQVIGDVVAQGRLNAPVDEGDLRRSGHREAGYAIASASGQKLIFTGRFDTDYAAIQHENESFEHPKGGKDHFITDPAEARKPEHLKIVSAAILRAIKKTAEGQ